jgi:hypothetical protein
MKHTTVLLSVLAILGVASAQASTPTGVWTNVTPANAHGVTQTVGADRAHPGTLYTSFNGDGVWKSTDYGQTWTGPVNTGTHGSDVMSDGGSGITVGSNGVIYFSCIFGNLIGFFKSTDGGVNWTYYNTPLSTGTVGTHGKEQDLYYPQIDPYNSNHLLMTAHEQPLLFQSFNGGQTWSTVTLAGAMSTGQASSGTAFAFFVNTGNATTTANTWLWIMQGTGGTVGTWRTANGGSSWKQVNTAEHNHGTSQIYQPNTTGDVFLPEVYGTATGYSATNAWGILHSTDYGQTWSLVGTEGSENVCTGTSKNIYCNNGAALAVGSNYQVSPVPGTGKTWTKPTPPSAWTWGTGQFVVVNDGTHNIIISANWTAGLWRYVEP